MHTARVLNLQYKGGYVMKKKFLLIALTICSLSGFAFPGSSALSVSSSLNRPMTIVIDGNRFHSAGNHFELNVLYPGYHRIEVYLQRNGIRGDRRSNLQPVYSGDLYVRPMDMIDIVINRFGRAYVDRQTVRGQFMPEEEFGLPGNPGTGYPFLMPMDHDAFGNLLRSLRAEAFESTRLSLAERVISGNRFTTMQVRQLMDIFDFDSNKLAIAKAARDRITDRTRFYTLADALTFNKNKEALIALMP